MKKQLLIFLTFLTVSSACSKAPKMMVFIVIDQFSAHYLAKLKPFLTGGIKVLMEEGTSYVNTFYDHSMPGTGPGHTLLTTGTYASFHGIVNNVWFDKDGKKIKCDDDTIHNAAVFAPDGTLYSYGKSAKNILVDTLSDQFIMYSYPHARNTVWSLSLKSRAAIAMAGRLGHALWFDEKGGAFTSSKAYFDSLPKWVTEFNATKNISSLTEVTWKPFFKDTSPAYHFKDIDNYRYSLPKQSIIEKPLSINAQDGFDLIYTKTPQANQALIDLALTCIKQNYTGKDTDRFILWLSLSSLDKVGHVFGPHSKEAIDMIYHIDHQLKDFMNALYQIINAEDVLFVLTGDHGVQPIPEIVRDQGMTLGRRYYYPHIIDHINTLIEKKYCIKNIIQHFKEPQFYLNQAQLATLTDDTKCSLYQDIKKYMLSLPGIRRAWTFNELQNESFERYDLDRYIQRELHKERSGQILYSANPYTTIDTYYPQGTKGTSHISSYAYDTHVPLIFYQKGNTIKKRITKNVYIPQISVTLATLFEVPRPSAATGNVLPHLHL